MIIEQIFQNETGEKKDFQTVFGSSGYYKRYSKWLETRLTQMLNKEFKRKKMSKSK